MKAARKIRTAVPKTEAAPHGEREPLGPLWVITICMGAFFGIAALVIMVG